MLSKFCSRLHPCARLHFYLAPHLTGAAEVPGNVGAGRGLSGPFLCRWATVERGSHTAKVIRWTWRNQTQTPFCLQLIDLCTIPTPDLLLCALHGTG